MKRTSRLLAEFFAFVCALGFFMGSTKATTPGSISLGMGQSHTVRLKTEFINVHVLNPKIADVVAYTKNTITVVGVSPGDTELLIKLPARSVRVRIFVRKTDVTALFRAVRDFLGPIEGVYPRLLGDLVILDGRALTVRDYGRIMAATELFGENVKNYAGYQPSAVKQINQIFMAAGLTTVQAHLIADMVFLEGAVGSKMELDKVNKIIETLNIKANNLISVGQGRQVLVEVQFIELQRSSNVNFGLQLPSAISASGAIVGQLGLYPAGQGNEVILNLQSPESAMTLQLNTLFQSGKARMLAKPKLICGSGESANFMVGGEIPIVHESQGSFSVEYKPFGIMLDIEPVADSRGNITAKIKTEVSEPDWAQAVKGYPAFITRRVDTRVTMTEGSTLVLSGLYSHKMSKSIHKFPLLGHIPILGELFKSRAYQREKSHLVVFITTRTVHSGHPWVEQHEKISKQRAWRFKDETEWEMFFE